MKGKGKGVVSGIRHKYKSEANRLKDVAKHLSLPSNKKAEKPAGLERKDSVLKKKPKPSNPDLDRLPRMSLFLDVEDFSIELCYPSPNVPPMKGAPPPRLCAHISHEVAPPYLGGRGGVGGGVGGG